MQIFVLMFFQQARDKKLSHCKRLKDNYRSVVSKKRPFDDSDIQQILVFFLFIITL